MLDRVYGEVPDRFKDGTAVYLMPGEQPRKPYPFPPNNVCPKCGKMCWSRKENGMFSCFWCGTVIPEPEQGIDVATRKPGKNSEYYRQFHEVVCRDCGKPFQTQSYSRKPMRCPDCRAIFYRNNKREQERLRRRNGKPSLCGNCGAVMSRDLNAAINLEKYYTGSSPGINACGEEGSGNRKRYVVKPSSVKQEVTTVDICP
jgi:DNA-directed RNA polymerase subunit RPC12/RpoP